MTTTLEKILIATGNINLLATQLDMLSGQKRLMKMYSVSSDEEALMECLNNLRYTMEELGNYIDNGEAFNEETLPLVNECFDILNDRGSSIETQDNEIRRLNHALQLISTMEDSGETHDIQWNELKTIAKDALTFQK